MKKYTDMENIKQTVSTHYLNICKSRWINYVNGIKESREWKTESGKIIKRRIIFYEFKRGGSSACISYQGKKITISINTILKD